MESLHDRVTFLQEFLEEEWKGAKDLEGRIADAAQAAEDAIESNIVDQVLSGSASQDEKGFDLLCRDLQKVIEDMDLIKTEALKVKETTQIRHQAPERSTITSLSRGPSIEKNKMVGFEDEKLQLMEKLASHHSSRQIISIVGMGGAGKTTLAKNVYDGEFIVQHFDTRAWVTISQEYKVEEILREVLSSRRNQRIAKNIVTSHDGLGEQVHKSLFGRRYLIILDDIWSIDCWDNIRRFFPNNKSGSRIVVTTRLSNLARQISTCSLEKKFLDEKTSWTLFCENAFAHKSCPHELEEIGRRITKNCKGLPLAIVVIGGLLKKSGMTLEYWEQLAEDVSSIISSGANDICLEILSRSCNHLPIYLKSCFLYMGVFGEDCEIRVSKLFDMWISEGFLKPIIGKSLDEITENFLKDLIERNLVLVGKRGSCGNIKSCKMHDFLRDLSLREALKEKVFYVIGTHKLGVPLVISNQRCIISNESTWMKTADHELLHSLLSSEWLTSSSLNDSIKTRSNHVFKLLRTLSVSRKYPLRTSYTICGEKSLEVAFQSINSRYIALETLSHVIFPSSICLLRNIQTIVVTDPYHKGLLKLSKVIEPSKIIAPSEIWDMSQLRHIEFDKIVLPNPPFDWNDQQHCIIMKNLHTLKEVNNFHCSEEVLEKIPNIKNLKVSYDLSVFTDEKAWHSLQNLACFQKLESFAWSFEDYRHIRNEFIRILFSHVHLGS